MLTRNMFIAALFCSLVISQCVGQLPHTITPDDILDLRDVTDAHISPTVSGWHSSWGLREDGAVRAIPISGSSQHGSSPARPFAASAQGETSPRWSPDGRFLAFISKRPSTFKLQALNGEGPAPHEESPVKDKKAERNPLSRFG